MNISLQVILFEFQGFNEIIHFSFPVLEVQSLAMCFNELVTIINYIPVCTQTNSYDLGCSGEGEVKIAVCDL